MDYKPYGKFPYGKSIYRLIPNKYCYNLYNKLGNCLEIGAYANFVFLESNC